MIVNQEMYEEGSACFDPIPMKDQTLGDQEQGLSYPQQDAATAAVAATNGAVAAAMELELQQQMGFESDHNCYNPNNNMEAHLTQDPSLSSWETVKQRRAHLNDTYTALKELDPNPTMPDRGSIVRDAIEYIKELQRTVNDLKVLVEKKRYSRERFGRHKAEDDSVLKVESTNMKPHAGDPDQPYNGSLLGSSWLQRKSKNAEVYVRIIDDEATIKLVQQKRINCLLFVSKVFDELQLDLQRVTSSRIGDFYSFLFNSKIYEGSSVNASAIANKLIDVVDRHYAASQPSNSY